MLRRLAVGGQSEVFLAMKMGPGTYSRPVVIKALPPERHDNPRHVRLFFREAFISSRFVHPNVINVHDSRIVEGTACMMMDFVKGQTVADIAQRGYQRKNPPTLKQVVQIVADSCNGLHYVHHFQDLDNHQYSVVHRDVSPQNLMVTYNGDTMLFDFGIARIIGMDDDDDIVGGGKYAYMSPEQVRGEPVDPRSDIFSMGVILYELATGFRLFRRRSQPEVLEAVLSAPIQRPRELRSEIPQFLENVIMKALNRDPFKRYQSANDMRKDLNSFLDLTADGADLRRGLGAYVAALFKSERSEIAMILQNAPRIAGDSEPLGSDESIAQLGIENCLADDSSMELAHSDVIVAGRLMQSTPAGKSRDATVVAVLEAQLGQKQRQQTILLTVIGILGFVAMVLIFRDLV